MSIFRSNKFRVVVSTLIIGFGVNAQALICETLLTGFDRDIYIRQTGYSERPIQNSFWTGWRVFGLPRLLRGMKLPGIFIRLNRYLGGNSPFGPIEILTPKHSNDWVRMIITALPGQTILTAQKLALLKEIYPGLFIKPGHPMPYQLELFMQREEGQKDFAFEARSLVNTLMTDPNGLLGVPPAMRSSRIPIRLRVSAFVAENLDFFKTFTDYKFLGIGAWSAVHHSLDLTERAVELDLDLITEQVSVTLLNGPRRADLEGDLNQIVSAFYKVDPKTRLELPSVVQDPEIGTHIHGLPMNRATVAFITTLIHGTRTNGPQVAPMILTVEQQARIDQWRSENVSR